MDKLNPALYTSDEFLDDGCELENNYMTILTEFLIVKLEESVKRLHESDEQLYLDVVDYSRRLALENRAIDILREHHSSDVVV